MDQMKDYFASGKDQQMDPAKKNMILSFLQQSI